MLFLKFKNFIMALTAIAVLSQVTHSMESKNFDFSDSEEEIFQSHPITMQHSDDYSHLRERDRAEAIDIRNYTFNNENKITINETRFNPCRFDSYLSSGYYEMGSGGGGGLPPLDILKAYSPPSIFDLDSSSFESERLESLIDLSKIPRTLCIFRNLYEVRNNCLPKLPEVLMTQIFSYLGSTTRSKFGLTCIRFALQCKLVKFCAPIPVKESQEIVLGNCLPHVPDDIIYLILSQLAVNDRQVGSTCKRFSLIFGKGMHSEQTDSRWYGFLKKNFSNLYCISWEDLQWENFRAKLEDKMKNNLEELKYSINEGLLSNYLIQENPEIFILEGEMDSKNT